MSLQQDMNAQGPLYLNQQQLALADVLMLQSLKLSVLLQDALNVIPRTICLCRYVNTLPVQGKLRLQAMTKHKHPLLCAIELSSLHLWLIGFLRKNRLSTSVSSRTCPVTGNLDYRRESPAVQPYIDGSRQKEWKKYENFQAAIPLEGKELSDLLEASMCLFHLSGWIQLRISTKSIQVEVGIVWQLRRCGRRTYRRPYFRYRNARASCSVCRVPRCTAVFVGHQKRIFPGDANRPHSQNSSTARRATRSRP